MSQCKNNLIIYIINDNLGGCVMQTNHIKITPRAVAFDFSDSTVRWIPEDAFSSHTFNAINLLLPAGEFWFCRVFNKALPLVTDPILKEDIRAFVKQEAMHARAHIQGQKFMENHNYEVESGIKKAELLFGQLLADQPFGWPIAKFKKLESYWLIMRVGIIAALEHFTGVIGQWTLDHSDNWDKYGADAEISDLFRWHLAEEVEHRSVAFDLFHHLLQNKVGFYVSRQVLIAGVFPVFMYLMVDVGRGLAKQDSLEEMQKMAQKNFFRLLWELEKVGRKTGNIPTFMFLAQSVVRWTSPTFHPETEGNTEQALAYFSKSKAVKAGKLS